MEDHCFNLHPCNHCGKYNNILDRCSKRKKYTRVKNHYGWMNSWKWSSIVKKIYQSCQRIHSRVLTHIVVDIFSSSHLVPDSRNNISYWQSGFKFQIPINREMKIKHEKECDLVCGHPKRPNWFVVFLKPPLSRILTPSSRQQFVVFLKPIFSRILSASTREQFMVIFKPTSEITSN
jgi:hypothetical protein